MPDETTPAVDPAAPPWFKQIKYLTLAAAMLIGGLVTGYKQLVDAGIWVPRSAIEREHDALARAHIGMEAEVVRVSADAVVKIYPDNAIYASRHYKTDNGGFTYRGCWLSAEVPKLRADKPPRHSIKVAFASPSTPPGIICPEAEDPFAFVDVLVESINERTARLRRTFRGGCVVTFIIDTVTGRVVEGGRCVCRQEKKNG